jgi:NADH-quinone oxidoreductase subunit M
MRVHPIGLSVLVAIVMASFLLSATASATASARSGGRIALSVPGKGAGPLVLVPGQGGRVGTLTVTNVGAEPLIVSRVAIFGDEEDIRSPSRLSARFVDGSATSAVLGPGASKDVIVSWMPDKEPRMKQAYGHVLVTSTDEQAGEVAMGFRAQLPTGLGWIGAHALSVLVLLPLLTPLVAGTARILGRRDEPFVQTSFVGVALFELLMSLWACLRFVPEVGRADGNDGYQLVERSVWIRSIGAEWYLGVDGLSVALVPLAAGLVLVAALADDVDRRSDAYWSALALLTSGIVGGLVALDLTLVLVAWQLVLIAIVMLVGGWGESRAEHAAAKVATYGAVGTAAMLAAFVALSRASGRSFLIDGTVVAHSFSIPELARTSFASRAAILGVPFVEMVWVLLVVAAAVATPIVPLHGWLIDAVEEAPGGAAVVIAGAAVALGPYLLVRVGLGAIPEGARWAGSSISALGVLCLVYGTLCAMAQRNLRRFVAYATVASAGGCLFGVGALTPQGIAAAVPGVFAHGLAAAMLISFASALERRVHTSELNRFGGLALETPALGLIAGIALATSLGVPGFAGFWGAFLSLLGGFVRHPVLAIMMIATFVASAAAHMRVARYCLFGRVQATWRQNRLLEPFGGRFPDATRRELLALVPLALVAVLLGIWPAPLLSPLAAAVRDLSSSVEPAGPDPTVGGR